MNLRELGQGRLRKRKNMKTKAQTVLYILLFSLGSACVCTTYAETLSPKINKKNISFTNDGFKLAGTLFVPEGKQSRPALVLTHSSGRDGRHMRGYQYMAQTFAEFGFATFIFDKRGVGDSEGKYVEADDLRNPAGDLVAAVNAIKNLEGIDKKRIGVLGISQGGWVAPLAATLSNDISFVVSLVGGGVSVKEQVLHNRKTELIARGWSDEKIELAINFARRLYTYVSTGIGYRDLEDDYAKASTSAEWFSFIKSQGFGKNLIKPESLKHPWFKSLAYDPREAEEKIKVPYLIILGEKDKHVPTAKSVKALNLAFCRSGFDKYKIIILPNEGHNTFRVKNGAVAFRASFKTPLIEWLTQFKN